MVAYHSLHQSTRMRSWRKAPFYNSQTCHILVLGSRAREIALYKLYMPSAVQKMKKIDSKRLS